VSLNGPARPPPGAALVARPGPVLARRGAAPEMEERGRGSGRALESARSHRLPALLAHVQSRPARARADPARAWISPDRPGALPGPLPPSSAAADLATFPPRARAAREPDEARWQAGPAPRLEGSSPATSLATYPAIGRDAPP
jgi:hypothetical protein